MGLDISFYKEVRQRSEVAYFRKVNFIVEYFNLDNCVDHVCSVDELTTLVERCKKVLEAKSEEVSKQELPTFDGFFCGATEYDDNYYQDVENVMNKVQNILDNKQDDESIVINAWW